MSKLAAIDVVDLPDSTPAAMGKELKVFAIAKRKDLVDVIEKLATLDSLATILLARNGKPEIASAKDADLVIIECRVIEIFEDLQTIREIRATRPLVPILALGVNQDPEFSLMIYQVGVTSYLPVPNASEVLHSQILGIYALSESTRMMEIKNNELVDTMRSLRKANNDLKIQTEQRILAERQRTEAEHQADIHRQTKVILDNLAEGYFSVDRTLIISSTTSRACTAIFGGEIAGQTLGDTLNLVQEKERYIKLGFEQVFENIIPINVAIEAIPHLVSTRSGRIVELAYTVVCDATENPEKIIVVASDITMQMAEKKKMRLRDDQNRCLLAILRNSDSFRNFIADFKKEIRILQDARNLAEVKRIFHTIKGNAAAFGLGIISKRIQLIEDRLTDMVELTSIVKFRIHKYANIVEEDLKNFLINQHEILQMSYEGEKKDQYILDELMLDDLKEIAKDSPIDIRDRLELTLEFIKQKPVLHSIHFYETRIKRLAEKLNKKVELKMSGMDMRVNYELLSGIMQNLIHPINNSCDHGIETPEERETLGKTPYGNIEIAFERPDDGYMRITVSDDGRGIDVDKLREAALFRGAINQAKLDSMTRDQLTELVFLDNVTTADEVTEISGRGIGMSALKAEVEKLNGAINIVTTPGRGTKIAIDIPYPQKLRKLLLTKQSPKILLCEDERSILDMYSAFFNNAGFNVSACSNGLDAILELSRSHFDAMVTDLRMPGLDAQEVITKLRKVRNDDDLMPIIMVSGYVTPEIKEALSIFPELTILEKPIKSSELLKHVERILGGAA